MPLHAYHHDNKSGDPGHPHHSSHSVPIDYLGSLGIQITSLEGPNFEDNARKIAKEQGYPVTEKSTFIWDLHEPLSSSSMVTHHAHKIKEASCNEINFKKFIIIPDYLAAIIAGSVYLDVEGVSRRIATENVRALMFLKDESDIQVLWDKEAEAHPIRQEYLKSMNIGL
ncbi:hypothetical protein C8J55DRAFT_559707 [Lentinula edodes]|uniref:Uncharacterized protein n=1 Tax=Lentinula lateritia TaxID=40482 RepID=A0A9W9AKN0_9AGAR|nr:hypothetical protein C8J55DRAFT_559707 [Lentinula edodes]